jgi:hypothetical protein
MSPRDRRFLRRAGGRIIAAQTSATPSFALDRKRARRGLIARLIAIPAIMTGPLAAVMISTFIAVLPTLPAFN